MHVSAHVLRNEKNVSKVLIQMKGNLDANLREIPIQGKGSTGLNDNGERLVEVWAR